MPLFKSRSWHRPYKVARSVKFFKYDCASWDKCGIVFWHCSITPVSWISGKRDPNRMNEIKLNLISSTQSTCRVIQSLQSLKYHLAHSIKKVFYWNLKIHSLLKETSWYSAYDDHIWTPEEVVCSNNTLKRISTIDSVTLWSWMSSSNINIMW